MADTPPPEMKPAPSASEEAQEEEAGGTEAAEAQEADAPAIYEAMVAMGAAPPRRKVSPQKLASGAVVDLGAGGEVKSRPSRWLR